METCAQGRLVLASQARGLSVADPTARVLEMADVDLLEIFPVEGVVMVAMVVMEALVVMVVEVGMGVPVVLGVLVAQVGLEVPEEMGAPGGGVACLGGVVTDWGSNLLICLPAYSPNEGDLCMRVTNTPCFVVIWVRG